MKIPIRWRLTFWYTGVLLALLLVLGTSGYLVLQYSLTAEIERQLDYKADEVLKSTKVVGTLPFFLRQIILPDVEVFAAPDVYLQVVTKEGEVAARSDNLGSYTLPVEKKVVEEIMKGQSLYTTFNVENEKFRMVVKPLVLEGSVVGLLQVARPLKPVVLALQRLQIILLVGGVVALVFSLWLGWLLSGKALKPIRHLAREAKEIGMKRDFSQRVRYEGPKDELGELAVTFNGMLVNLDDAYSRLSDTLKLQQRFVADASHELRTPLTSIQGNVEFLLQLEGGGLEVQKEALSDIAAETKRLSRLVRELLTLARADAGYKLKLEEITIQELLEEVARHARFLVKGQDFEVDLHQGSGIMLATDPDYFKQMLLIFLDNALKYTPAGKKVVFKVERKGEKLGIQFQDEGPGIPPEDLPFVFERFYRVQSSRSGEGAGLGLAIAKWIVEEHGGIIKVESRVGKGTFFEILLPILRDF